MPNRSTPQLEDGFVRIATEWLEAFVQWRGPARVKDFVMAVVRETWGWNETWREIPLSRFAAILGTSRDRAKQLRQEAFECNLIEWQKGTGSDDLSSYRVQKDWLEWVDYRAPKGRKFPASPGETVLTGGDEYNRGLPVTPPPGKTGITPPRLDQSTPINIQVIDREKDKRDSLPEVPKITREQLLSELPEMERALVVGYLDNCAEENTSKRITHSRATSEITALLEMREKLDTEDAAHGGERWRYGLAEANRRSIPNLRYVEKAARGWQGQGGLAGMRGGGNGSGRPPVGPMSHHAFGEARTEEVPA